MIVQIIIVKVVKDQALYTQIPNLESNRVSLQLCRRCPSQVSFQEQCWSLMSKQEFCRAHSLFTLMFMPMGVHTCSYIASSRWHNSIKFNDGNKARS